MKMCRTNRGHRLGPFSVAVEEDVESQYLRYLTNQPQGVLFSEAVDKFNANIAYSGLNHAVSAEGLFAENKEKLITTTLQALLQREGVFVYTHAHTCCTYLSESEPFESPTIHGTMPTKDTKALLFTC